MSNQSTGSSSGSQASAEPAGLVHERAKPGSTEEKNSSRQILAIGQLASLMGRELTAEMKDIGILDWDRKYIPGEFPGVLPLQQIEAEAYRRLVRETAWKTAYLDILALKQVTAKVLPVLKSFEKDYSWLKTVVGGVVLLGKAAAFLTPSPILTGA